MDDEVFDADLLIVGMGPVGAAAANIAGMAGLRTVVIERDVEPYSLPRAIVFDAEIMRAFAAIGLSDEITRATRPLGGSVYLGADHQPIRTFRAHPRSHELAWHPSNLFYQPQLEAILRAGLDRFSNVTVRSGEALTGIDANGSGVTARTANGASITARYLFACDGASSTVRKALGVALDDIGFEERWLVVDTKVTGAMRWPDGYGVPEEVRDGRYSLMVCDPERPCTLIPGRGTHRRWEYMLLPGERDEEVVGDGWLREHIGRWVDPTHVEIIRTAVYRFRALVAERWRQGPVFLLGDAAHQTPPFFGQGMCHGIRDAAQLIWKLGMVLDGRADDALLDTYQPEREPHVRAIIAASVTAGAEVCKLDYAQAIERDAAFRAAERARNGAVAMTDVVPPIRSGIIDPASGGMRLPEFVVSGAGGLMRLDAALGGKFTLLSLVPMKPPAGWRAIGGHEVVPEDDRFAAWLDDRAARWAIVRPDRYVYATGTSEQQLAAAVTELAAALGTPVILEAQAS